MKIEHVAIYVIELEKAIQFFEIYLNAKTSNYYYNEDREFTSVFLHFESGAKIELMHRPDMVDTYKGLIRTGLIHLSFSLGSRENVDQLTERLILDGYELIQGPRVTGNGYYQSSFFAFEGNQIELTV